MKLGAGEAICHRNQAQKNLSMLQESGTGGAACAWPLDAGIAMHAVEAGCWKGGRAAGIWPAEHAAGIRH